MRHYYQCDSCHTVRLDLNDKLAILPDDEPRPPTKRCPGCVADSRKARWLGVVLGGAISAIYMLWQAWGR